MTPAERKKAEEAQKAAEVKAKEDEKKAAEASKGDREAAKKAKEAARKNLKKWKKVSTASVFVLVFPADSTRFSSGPHFSDFSILLVDVPERERELTRSSPSPQ